MADASQSAEDFVPAGLAALGIEVDDIEAAVVAATHQVFWPAIGELMALDTTDVEPERNPDLSRAP